jgi:hypothetical protein
VSKETKLRECLLAVHASDEYESRTSNADIYLHADTIRMLACSDVNSGLLRTRTESLTALAAKLAPVEPQLYGIASVQA